MDLNIKKLSGFCIYIAVTMMYTQTGLAQSNTVVVVPLGNSITEVERVSQSVTVNLPANSNGEAGGTVNCPPGKKVLSGGGSEIDRLVMVDSYPNSQTSWTTRWTLDKLKPASNFLHTVYAYCAKVADAAYEIVSASASVNPTNSSESGTSANCPQGSLVVGGGGEEGNALIIADSFPSTDNRWTATWVEDVGSANGSESVTVYAVCVKL